MKQNIQCVRVLVATGVLFSMAQGCARPAEQQPPPAAAPVAQAGCQSDDECKAAPGGAFCVNSACVACRDDATCGAGQTCRDGACAARVENAGREMAIPEYCNGAAKPVRFAFDSAELTAESQAVLNEQATCLLARQQVQLVLEGHCDDRGTQEYNLALGERRASAVRAYLAHQGVPADGLRTISKGKNEPVCSESTDQCWAMNRRVEWK